MLALRPHADSQPVATVNETGLFALAAFLLLVVPIVLFLLIAFNLAVTIFSTVTFELVGHILLRAYGRKGSEIRLMSSVKVGAVGGAIVAIPFNILYTTLEGLLSPPARAQSVEEQGATEPLLQSQIQGGESTVQDGSASKSTSPIYNTTQLLSSSVQSTSRNPFHPRIFTTHRAVESPSKIRLWLALIVDFVSGPALGALAGAVGSAVLRNAGHKTLDVATAAEAGALGGFILGAIAAFIFSALLTCALTAYWVSRRP